MLLLSLCLNGCDATVVQTDAPMHTDTEEVSDGETSGSHPETDSRGESAFETESKGNASGSESTEGTVETDTEGQMMTETDTEVVIESQTVSETDTDVVIESQTVFETVTEVVNDGQISTETATSVVDESQMSTETATDVADERQTMFETETDVATESCTVTEIATEVVTESQTVTESASEVVTDDRDPTETATDAVIESQTFTEAITEEVTEKETTEADVTEKSTEKETEKSTEKPTEKETEKSTEKETDAEKICDVHSDTDNNGYCDDCSISVVIVLDIFAINDLHGKFCDSSTQIGVDEMTTYFKQAYTREDYVIILSSGDMWQGSSESNLTKGNIVTEWMNYIDVTSMTLGNHEYDWGEEQIAQNAALAEFPFLAINVYDSDTNMLADYCQPSVLVERGGATIGIIGAIGDCHSSISGEVSGGFYFKTGSELTALVKAEAQRLRSEGADFIIYSIHDGYGSSSSGIGNISDSNLRSYYDPSLSEGYVDIVFEGHSHMSYVLIDGDGVYHLQGGGDNKGISHAEVEINFANGNFDVENAEFVPSSVYADLTDDPIVNTLMEKYEEQVAAGAEVLGYNDTFRDSTELCQLIADLYIKAGEKMFGDRYDIVLGGGFIKARSPYNLGVGNVTYAQVQSIFTFNNELVLCSIKGSDLKSKFINSTNSDYYISFSAYGNSVKNNIKDNATYYVVVDTYTSTYAYNRLTEVARYTAGVYARDLLADYIREGGMGEGGMGEGAEDITYTSISEILEIGEGLDDNALTSQYYFVKGTVSSIKNSKYGNLYIKDASGNQLYVYGTYDSSGSVRYDAMADPPTVGDEVVLCAQIKRYVNDYGVTIELVDAKLISCS